MGVHRSGSLVDLEGSEHLDLQSKAPTTRGYPRSRTNPNHYFQPREEESESRKPKSIPTGALEATKQTGDEDEC